MDAFPFRRYRRLRFTVVMTAVMMASAAASNLSGVVRAESGGT
jgi:hypothetical protein